jgi:hypothetical protein
VKEFHPYSIEFVNGDDSRQILEVFAASPGHAFQKCAERFPKAKMLGGFRWGWLPASGWVCIRYDAPSTANVEAMPAPNIEERTFSFFDDCVGKRRIITS